MRIKEVAIKNFRSFSNKETIINFENKFSIFVGENGSGKTSILIAIRYALFGTNGMEIKVDDLVNNINRDNMKVKLICEKNGKEIIIERGRLKKQSFIKLFIDKKEIDLPSVKDYDEKIKELIGFDYKMFNFFFINSSIFSNNFFKMKKSQRDEFIKKILGIEDFYKFIEKLKEKKKEYEYKKDIESKELDFLQKLIEQKKEKKEKLKKNLLIKTKKRIEEELKKLQQKKEKILEEINSLKENLNKEKKLNQFISEEKAFKKILKEQKEKIQEINIEISLKEIEKEIKLLKEKIKAIKIYEKKLQLLKAGKNKFYNKIVLLNKQQNNFIRNADKITKAIIATEMKGTYLNKITKGNIKNFINKHGDNILIFLFISDTNLYFSKEQLFKNFQITLNKKTKLYKQYLFFKNSIINKKDREKKLDEINSKKKELLTKYKVFIKEVINEIKKIKNVFDDKQDYQKELEKLYQIKNNVINKENLLQNIEKTKEKIKKIEEEKKNLLKYEGSYKKYEKVLQELNDINNQINSLELNKKIYDEIKELKKDIKIDNEQIKKRKNNIKKIQIKIQKIEEIIKKDALNAVRRTVEDFLKIFNFYIEKYRNDMNINKFIIKIKNDFSFLLKERGKFIDYNTLSKGEETILNLIMILALNDTLKIMSNINFNLLIFDEIDGTLDEDNLYTVIDKIASLNKEVLLVSHRKEIFEIENNYENMVIYQVNKDFFTRIKRKN